MGTHTQTHGLHFLALIPRSDQFGLYLRLHHTHGRNLKMASGYQNIDASQSAPVYSPSANTTPYADQESLYSGPTSYGSPSSSETTSERPSWVSVGGVRTTWGCTTSFISSRPDLACFSLPRPLPSGITPRFCIAYIRREHLPPRKALLYSPEGRFSDIETSVCSLLPPLPISRLSSSTTASFFSCPSSPPSSPSLCSRVWPLLSALTPTASAPSTPTTCSSSAVSSPSSTCTFD